MDWDAVRREFPALQNWTYLNTAAYGQVPKRGVEAVARHFAHRDELACQDFLQWFDDMDHVRGLIGRLIHCTADDIAFVQNASTALALLLSGLEWKAGDRVITLEGEFPNNLYAPGGLAGRGVEFIECPWDRFYESVNDRTRLVLLSSANYITGFVPPLEEISKFLRSRGVLLFVDGTQSVGALQFEVGRLQPDMLAVHGYKWLLCPNGAGFVYVRPELRDRLPANVVGWRSHRDWRAVDNLHHGAPEPSSRAEKYEGGMLPFALIYAMQASIEMMLEIGPDLIEQRVLQLADQVRATLRDCGATVASHRSPIVAGQFPGRDAAALARSLQDRRVLVSARHGMLRVSPHLYNNEQDLESFGRELRAVLV